MTYFRFKDPAGSGALQPHWMPCNGGSQTTPSDSTSDNRSLPTASLLQHRQGGSFRSLEIHQKGASMENQSLGPLGDEPRGHHVGVDRVSVMMPVHDAAPDLRRDRHRQMPVGGAAPRIELRGQPGNLSLRLDLNPSKVLYPTSTGPLPPEAVAEALDAVATAFDLDRLVNFREPLGQARLTRVDTTVDFREVVHAQILFEAQLHLPRGRDGECRAYSAKGGGLTGVQVGGKREFVKLYEKDDGLLRYEAQARRDGLDRAGMGTVADITRETVEALARRRWDAALFGLPVVGTDDLMDRIQATDWRGDVKSRLLGDLMLISSGRKPQWSNDRRASFYKLLTEIGVIPAPGVLGKGRFTIRLDFDTATEVVEGASP
jgi:hypothetical protein